MNWVLDEFGCFLFLALTRIPARLRLFQQFTFHTSEQQSSPMLIYSKLVRMIHIPSLAMTETRAFILSTMNR